MARHGGDSAHNLPVHFKRDLLKKLAVSDEDEAAKGAGTPAQQPAVFTSPNIAYNPSEATSNPGKAQGLLTALHAKSA